MSRSSQPGFETVAPFYPQMEQLLYGQRLQRGRFHFLPALAHCRQLLLLGEGNGRFLQRLLQVNPTCAVTVVEISPAMIASARKKLTASNAQRVTWIPLSVLSAELDTILPASTFDAVVTHYLFDLFNAPEQRQLFQVGFKALAPGGLWQDTEFLNGGPTRASRLRNNLMLAVSYHVLATLCNFPARQLTDHLPLFHRDDLRIESEYVFNRQLTARLWRKAQDAPLSSII